MFISSRSCFSFPISASRFLFNSTWAAVAPPASSRRSPICSTWRARTCLAFSAFERACTSLMYSSPSSSMRAMSSLACFPTLAVPNASSSIFAARACNSLSFLANVLSSSFWALSRSDTASWASLRSPSTFLFAFSILPRSPFSLSSESSSSSRFCSSFPFTFCRWLHLSSTLWWSSAVLWLASKSAFFSFAILLISSSWWAISSPRFFSWASLVSLSCWAARSLPAISSRSPLTLPISASAFFAPLYNAFLASVSLSSLFCASASWDSTSAFWAISFASFSRYCAAPPLLSSSASKSAFFSEIRTSFSAPNLTFFSLAMMTFSSAWIAAASRSASIFCSRPTLSLGLSCCQNPYQSHVRIFMYFLKLRWTTMRLTRWVCAFLNHLRDFQPLTWACRKPINLPK